jgi:galactonate dehydratase
VKIETVETLHCDAGWRPWTFIKIVTEGGLTGISEITDSHGSPSGIEGIVRDLRKLLLGQDPRQTNQLYWDLYRATRQSPGGVIQKAIGGIENALLDIKARALDVPVYELFGGALRNRIELYWSHCGTSRARAAHHVNEKPVQTLADITELGREVRERGFRALKTNIVQPGLTPPVYMPGFGAGPGTTDLNATRELFESVVALFEAFREGAGEDVGLILDCNFNFKPEGYIKIARALEHFDPLWIEMDIFDPAALRTVKDKVRVPICSGENLYGTRGYKPYLERYAVDIAMVDVIWNGFAQSAKIADLAELHEINVAPHNYYSHLSTMITAHFCAVIPNLRIMEVDVDDVPWKDGLVTVVPAIEDGMMTLPDGPGWGTELNEDVLAAHPRRV